jgi:hypothetical protein
MNVSETFIKKKKQQQYYVCFYLCLRDIFVAKSLSVQIQINSWNVI